MTESLSNVFRANVEAIRQQRGLTVYGLGKIVTPRSPEQARTQLRANYGHTLATVEQWSDRLGVSCLVLLTPGGVQNLDNAT